MQWLRKLWDVLFSLDGGQPKCFFPDRAAAEAKVRREARYALRDLEGRMSVSHKSVGDLYEIERPLATESFTDNELYRICRDAIRQRYGVRVFDGILKVDYYISGPDF